MPEAATARQPEEQSAIESPAWTHVLTLPCRVAVDLPLHGFHFGDLARLSEGMVIEAHWSVGDDIPLRVNGQLVAWGEFEVVGSRLAVRVTELA